ncbi:hypothetical protein [Bradyrhizobium retamae]|uniref:Uncharacterized protein n=1 Tax=Bradyrhizobium retamae TaxID=1300035 RepID=A0A0R3NIB2_9BRAD|nr:hypothetical protein [Bradyrhizobium retamae]KRR29542.1 hypothetical protein CQ13_16670 [Bradyrhizobium retamae]
MDDERVQKKILETVASLARYEIDVWTQVGPGVQVMLVDAISALPPEDRVQDRDLVIAVCEAVLSPEMEGAVWNANSVTLRAGRIPINAEIIKIREKAISILFELFKAAIADGERREILSTLRRAGHTGSRTEATDDWLNLTLKNATEVVEFLLGAAGPLSYELMQTLEHVYWYKYRRARDVSRSKARVNCQEASTRLMTAIEKLRDKFNEDQTFAKFKVLVGFESIFPYQWKERDENRADNYETQKEYRAAEAAKYIEAIGEQNEAEWLALIERIASVESNDMATFPPFAQFLTQLARSKPQTAARLLGLASDKVAGFLAAILAGLHESGEDKIYQNEVERVLQRGKYLAALARHLRLSKSPNVELAKRTLQRSMEVQQDVAVAECLITAMEAKPEDVPSKEAFFEPAIEYLNRKHEYWWTRAAWLPDQASSFFASLLERQARLLMPAMIQVPKVDYYVEQILIQIAKCYPALVWDCFASRLGMNKEDSPDRYEAIPYEFHGLQNELSKDPKLAIEFGRRIFNEIPRLFRFRGGRLLSIAFPSCPPNFAEELAKLADEGTKEDVEFILAVMENYHGEETTQEVLKRIIKRFPKDESIRTSVIISLESTGIVRGEFGFADALRDKLEIARGWQTDPRPEVRAFADAHIHSLQLRIADEQQRAEERKALRELQYEQTDELKDE